MAKTNVAPAQVRVIVSTHGSSRDSEEDEDEALGELIYRSSATAKALARAVPLEKRSEGGGAPRGRRKRKADSIEGDDDDDVGSKEQERAVCSVGGCKNKAERGGICRKHGGKQLRVYKRCSRGDCANRAVKGGLCWRHGAHRSSAPEEKRSEGDGAPPGRGKREAGSIEGDDDDDEDVASKEQEQEQRAVCCSVDGCKNKAQLGGVCYKHGGKQERRRCSREGCANNAAKGGVCWRHGGKWKKKTCSREGCTRGAVKGGVCRRHGAKVKRCGREGCTKQAHSGGACFRHGAKRTRDAVTEAASTTHYKKGARGRR